MSSIDLVQYSLDVSIVGKRFANTFACTMENDESMLLGVHFCCSEIKLWYYVIILCQRCYNVHCVLEATIHSIQNG